MELDTTTFFFLLIRRPTTSTLFPTRRSSDLDVAEDMAVAVAAEARESRAVADVVADHDAVEMAVRDQRANRSEEHTSELQSQSNLVCRLLLEKKKMEVQ